FCPQDIDNDLLREFLELDPIEVIEQSVADIKTYGWEKFRDLLSLAAPDVRMGILGMLGASLGLGLLTPNSFWFDRTPESS
ncbi:MAG: hypothetical protein ACFBSE_23675, partial [Prochloraceae cyanobacterium]